MLLIAILVAIAIFITRDRACGSGYVLDNAVCLQCEDDGCLSCQDGPDRCGKCDVGMVLDKE